jgi:hypothetical protein
MAEASTPDPEPVIYAVVGEKRYPFIAQLDLTGRQVDWIEGKCGKSMEDASAENRQVLTSAYVAVCVAAATPSADLETIFTELWDLPVSQVGIIAELPTEPAEAGPTKPARTRAKSADSGSQK